MNAAEYTYMEENMSLSGYAFRSDTTKGRERYVDPDGLRTEFQRDRDRILHSKSFRRLTHKTQVFLDPEGDHYRTRLTHTLEVMQIGRTLAHGLRLNCDLVEAACYGHDLGHTPFGHAGEAVLNSLYSEKGFRHNEQSLRVVDRIENSLQGLNLTAEVREAILCHTGKREASTLEGRLIKHADRIAYINHDIDDALRAGIIMPDEIPKNLTDILGETHSKRIATMVRSVIDASAGKAYISSLPYIQEAADNLRKFLFERVYSNNLAKIEEKKADKLLTELFSYFLANTASLPEEYRQIAEEEGHERAVCDYIAGMTDRYAINLFTNIFVPKTWTVY